MTTESEQPAAEHALTLEGLATLLLRILGLYFVVYGITGLLGEAGLILLRVTNMSLEEGLRAYRWEYLVRPVAELIVGMYFLTGGQWVFDNLLVPIIRSSEDDENADSDEEGGDGGPAIQS